MDASPILRYLVKTQSMELQPITEQAYHYIQIYGKIIEF